jgi:hypothetical protein
MPTIVATPGAANANSYLTRAEAQAYFDARLSVAGWDDADDQDVLLIMATRVIDAIARPLKTFVPAQGGIAAYYRTRRTWTGAPASTTQRLAWPRTGMYDGNGNSLDFGITSITVASPTIVTTSRPHGRATGDIVFVTGSDSTPLLDGAHAVTVISSTTFSIAVNVTVAGTTGSMTIIPQDLKEATAEMAGQLGNADRTLDNDVIVQGLTSVRAGSVALTFKDMIETRVLPDAVWDLMPPSWFTAEVITPAWPALFDVVS